MLRGVISILGFLAFVDVSFAAGLMPATLTVGGLQRSYLIDVPAGGQQEPTVIMLHGLGGDAQGVAAATRLAPLGEQDGFVTVFPDAMAHQWDHFLPGTVPAVEAQRYNAVGGPPDDLAFLKALVDDLVTRHIADPRRIYLGGFSNGGFMAMRMICDDADAFAAVALISSSMPAALGQSCRPAKPIPILMEKGTADPNVPYRGGYVLDHSFTVWSAARLATTFTRLDGCSGKPAISVVPGTKNPIRLSSWTTCSDGPVALYTMERGVHAVYQVPPPSTTLWAFFAPHSR